VVLALPLLKKGEPAEKLSSYRLTAISSVFFKPFEIVVLGEISGKCKLPSYQLDLLKGLLCTPVHFIFLLIYYLRLIICGYLLF